MRTTACGVSNFLEGKLILWCVYLFFSGGETIRNIINMCGAHVELNRAIPESAPTKYFIIRGTPSCEIFFCFVLIMWRFCHWICLFVCLFYFFVGKLFWDSRSWSGKENSPWTIDLESILLCFGTLDHCVIKLCSQKGKKEMIIM